MAAPVEFKCIVTRGEATSVGRKKEPDCSGSSDKVIYALTQALRRVVRPTFIRCSNLTTSKTFLPTLNEQRNFFFSIDTPSWQIVQILFQTFFWGSKPSRSLEPGASSHTPDFVASCSPSPWPSPHGRGHCPAPLGRN